MEEKKNDRGTVVPKLKAQFTLPVIVIVLKCRFRFYCRGPQLWLHLTPVTAKNIYLTAFQMDNVKSELCISPDNIW